jgi:iron complex transport system substrate-binding protein
MKKIISALLTLVLLLSVFVTSCQETEEIPEVTPEGTTEETTQTPPADEPVIEPENEQEEPVVTTPGPRTITDFAGNEVIIPPADEIENIAVLTSPPNIITFVLGINDMLCATSNPIKNSVFLKRLYPRLEEIPAVRAGAGKINIEALLMADPDVCLGSSTDLQPVDDATDIPTIRCMDVASLAYPKQQQKEVRFWGELFGKEEQAEKYCSYVDNNVATINAAVGSLTEEEKMKVYVGFNADHLTTFGSDTFMDEFIAAAGCINAAHPVSTLGGAEGGLASISMEQVLEWNPDIVIIDTGTAEDLYADPLWADIPAIKNKQVYLLPRGMFGWNRASVEPAALFPMWLALQVYPDKFPDNDIDTELKRFYREIINYELTESDVTLILTGK